MSKRTIFRFLRAGRRGFTLIELLIVVAIIAILAAIAIPNMLEAQTRAKVSRIKSDLRTLATGIESYCIDWGRPMYDGEPNADHYGWVNAFKQMTTPVAYLTSIPADPFQDEAVKKITLAAGQTFYVDHPADSKHSYDYGSSHWHGVGHDPEMTKVWMDNFKDSSWKVGSCGPDQKFVVSEPYSFYGFGPQYDPSNGTISEGDIYRSAGKMP